MYHFSEELAQEAADMIAVYAEQMIRPKGTDNGLCPNGGGLHIIVGTSKGIILARADVGNRSEWTGPYDEIAESNFKLTSETNKPTTVKQLSFPELMEGPGNSYFWCWGSCIDSDIVVACSGVDPEWNEAYSKMGCGLVRAMVIKKQKGETSKE